MLKIIILLFSITTFYESSAQLFNTSTKIDSLKLYFSNGNDSTWFIRQEQLNENSEKIVVVSFKNSGICLADFDYDNFRKIIIKENINSCLKNDSNKVELVKLLQSYQGIIQKRQQITVGHRKMLIETHSKKYEYYLPHDDYSDYSFTRKLLLTTMHDLYTGKFYINPFQGNRKIKKKKSKTLLSQMQ